MKKTIIIFSGLLLGVALIAAQEKTAQTSSPPKERLSFLIVGGQEGLIKRFGPDYRKIYALRENSAAAESFLLAIAEKPLNKGQIASQSRLSLGEVEEIASSYLSLNLITPKNNGWATTVPVITDREMEALGKNLAPLAEKIATQVSRFIPQIKSEYDQTPAAAGPAWEKVSHLFIDLFLMDYAFLHYLEKLETQKGYKKYYTEKQDILPAFYLELGKNFTNFGCNSYSYENKDKTLRIEVLVLHGTLFGRIGILVNRYDDNPNFHSALFKLPRQAAGGPPTFSENENKILEALGWKENEKLLVPVLEKDALKHLRPFLEKAAESAAEAVFENFDFITSAFQKSPYAAFLDGAGDYIQYCYHVLMYLTIKKLIQKGFLPPIPNPFPEYFANYVVYEKLK
jgi:hypothetical protein